jgi:hypothetical protein
VRFIHYAYYLTHSYFEILKLITKFRFMCDHELELGRYVYELNRPRNLRTCKKKLIFSKNIDNEFHFFFHCNKNQNIQAKYFL